jgi:hypothetical protein
MRTGATPPHPSPFVLSLSKQRFHLGDADAERMAAPGSMRMRMPDLER